MLREAGLVHTDLDERTPIAILSNAVTASGHDDGLRAAAQRSLDRVAETRCARAILIDRLTDADRWTWGRPNPDGQRIDPAWIVYLVGRERDVRFPMQRGASHQYEQFLTEHLHDLGHDSDVIG